MQLIEIITSVILGSGFGTFISQKLFEHHLKKSFFRFSKLYSDKLDIIRELYRLLIQAERALNLLLNQSEPYENSEKEKFKSETFEKLDRFIEYFEENEIIFDSSIISIIDQFREKFNIAKQKHNFATMLELDRGSKEWSKAVVEKVELKKKYIVEIPILKAKLKDEFQEKYKLLIK